MVVLLDFVVVTRWYDRVGVLPLSHLCMERMSKRKNDLSESPQTKLKLEHCIARPRGVELGLRMKFD